MIHFDIPNRRLDVELTDAQIEERLKDWKEPAPHFSRGVFKKYVDTVSSAARGAVTN